MSLGIGTWASWCLRIGLHFSYQSSWVEKLKEKLLGIACCAKLICTTR